MLNELNAVEKIVEEVLIDLMTKRLMFERVMSTSIQASLMRGVQSCPSTSRGDGPSQPSAEKRAKHKDDLENVKLILTILSDYILPLASVVSKDSVPRDIEYTMVTTYLLKRICIV
jgi:hypothetical protein